MTPKELEGEKMDELKRIGQCRWCYGSLIVGPDCPKNNKDTFFCSANGCCPCCKEFQRRWGEEKDLYMDNEKEWQQVFLKRLKELEDLRAQCSEYAKMLDIVFECARDCSKLSHGHFEICIAHWDEFRKFMKKWSKHEGK